MSVGNAPAPSFQQIEAFLPARQYLRGSHHIGLRRRQFQRQRDAFQPRTQLRHIARITRRYLEVRLDRLRSVGEQRDTGNLHQVFRRRGFLLSHFRVVMSFGDVVRRRQGGNWELTLTFQARALYPVRAQAVASQAYAYYRPEWRGESLGGKIVVSGRA